MDQTTKIKETKVWVHQLIDAYTSRGDQVIAYETIHDTTAFDEFKPKGTNKAIVIYLK